MRPPSPAPTRFRLRKNRLALSGALFSSLLWVGLSLACSPQESPAPEPPVPEEVPEPPILRPLQGGALLQALERLQEHLPESVEVLELRASGEELRIQYLPPSSESEENEGGESPAEDSTEAETLQELRYVFSPHPDTLGAVTGPRPIPLEGTGDLKENLFPLSDIDLSQMVAAFPIAQKAVDPLDGQVSSLVVRRFLPFHRSIRARIFVDSPRMNGSIDTNQRGIPLK